jgi:hypothetical protein
VLQAKERASTPNSSIVFTLDSHLSLSRSLGARHKPTIVEMDVETEVLFNTSSPNASMLKSIPLNKITTLTITKKRLKKINIIKKL